MSNKDDKDEVWLRIEQGISTEVVEDDDENDMVLIVTFLSLRTQNYVFGPPV